MAHVLIMPRQGNTVESCIIGEWKAKEGDTVRADTPVCVVETDKATFEVPAGAEGTVLKILRPAGDDVPVLEPIMVVGNPGEDFSNLISQSHKAENEAKPIPGRNSDPAVSDPGEGAVLNQNQSPKPQDHGESLSGEIGRPRISPRAKRLAEAEAIDPAELGSGSGPEGRIIEQDVAASLARRPPLTKAARDEIRKRLAAGLKVDVHEEGTGLGGRITAAELEAVFSAKPAPKTDSNAADLKSIDLKLVADEYSDTPIKGIRKLIADQMQKSCSTTASFTLNSSARAVRLQDLRTRFKNTENGLGMNRITINDLILYAVSRVLPLYSYMNAHKLDGTIRTWKNVHLGIAVSTGRGLMVPVIRNADKLSLTQISAQARGLAEACRSGSVSPDDLHGSTFTVSNLGNTGIESFSPVINIPEVAILGVCSITPKPAEISAGHYEILPHLGLSLTIDHAVVDGAPAAEFLNNLCKAIQDIDLWLIRQ